MAQLAERSLPIPEIRSSNPDIGIISNVFICQLLSRKDENKEKESGKGPLKSFIKRHQSHQCSLVCLKTLVSYYKNIILLRKIATKSNQDFINTKNVTLNRYNQWLWLSSMLGYCLFIKSNSFDPPIEVLSNRLLPMWMYKKKAPLPHYQPNLP